MIQLHGLYWPNDVGDKHRHALKHLASLDVGTSFCTAKRTAIQAGGNVGLWPRRLAKEFANVFTFEPDEASRACLQLNVPNNVFVSSAALGRTDGMCGLHHKGLGSHRVVEDGTGTLVTTIDALDLYDLDYLQLDIEGYEGHAIQGGLATIQRCHPVIQVELRDFSARYGLGDHAVRSLLSDMGYRQIARAQGSDFIFRWGGA